MAGPCCYESLAKTTDYGLRSSFACQAAVAWVHVGNALRGVGSRLGELSVSDNQLTGPIPDAFDGKSRLHGLSLSNNKLSGVRVCQRHTHAAPPRCC